MIDRRLTVNLVTFAAVAALVTVWGVVSLFGGGGEPAARVAAELEATAGLRPASDVTYLGQPVGSVERVDLVDDRVEAALHLDRDDLPAEVSATVRRRSAVGEPYLDLAPLPDAARPPAGPTLGDGDRIDLARTALPRSYSELFSSVAELFGAVEADDVATILGEVTTALDGRSATIQRVLRDGASVAQTFADRADVIEAAIDEAAALTATLESRSGTIARTFDDLADIGDAIDQLSGDYATLVGQDDAFLARSTEILQASRGDLTCTIVSLRQVADALDDTTLSDLEAVLDATPRVREILARVRDHRDDGPDFLTVTVLLSDRPVGGQPPRRDRSPELPPLGTCDDPPPLSEPADEAATAIDDRSTAITEPGASASGVDREQDEEADDVAASTEEDLTGDPPPIGPILMLLGALAVVGAMRPWRAFGDDG